MAKMRIRRDQKSSWHQIELLVPDWVAHIGHDTATEAHVYQMVKGRSLYTVAVWRVDHAWGKSFGATVWDDDLGHFPNSGEEPTQYVPLNIDVPENATVDLPPVVSKLIAIHVAKVYAALKEERGEDEMAEDMAKFA